MDIEKRIKMAAESILENEALRAGLDDEAASALLDWGMARAKQIAAESADVKDDDEASEAAYPRMRALYQILRDAVSLSAENVETAQQTGLLQEIAEQTPLVYGPANTFEVGQWAQLAGAPDGNRAQRINRLRTCIESGAKKPVTANTSVTQATQKKHGFFDWLWKR